MEKFIVPKISFVSGEVSPLMDARVTHEQYQSGCKRIENFYVKPHGVVTRRPGTRFVAETKTSSTVSRVLPFTFSVVQSYIIEAGDQYLRFYKDQGQIVTTGLTPYEIAAPWTAGGLSTLTYCQSADKMYFAHRGYPPMELTRTGHTAWTLATSYFGADVTVPTGLSIYSYSAGSGYYHRYKVTALNGIKLESEGSTTIATQGQETLDSGHYLGITWSLVTDATEYHVYKEKDDNGIYGYIGLTTGGTYYDKGGAPDMEETPPEIVDPFDSTDNYPGSVTFHGQRLIWAGTNNQPQTIWGGVLGDTTNLNQSSAYRDDDAFEFTLASNDVNVVQWMVSTKLLLVGTNEAEWHVSGSDGGAITPTSVSAARETQHGSSSVQPVVWGNVVMFVDRAGKTVRGYTYQLDIDGYAGPDLSILAEHLTRSHTIVDWTLQKSTGIIWAVRSDGTLLSLTYQRDHQVVAWARHETDGWVESVTTIPGTDRDEVWMIVRRTINGATKRYVELLEAEFNPDDVEDGQSSTTNAFFVDCGLTYDDPLSVTSLSTGNPAQVTTGTTHGLTAGDYVRITDVSGPAASVNGFVYTVATPATTTFLLKTKSGAAVDASGFTPYVSGGYCRKMVQTISGLDHLAGETLDVLADGAVFPHVTVTTGGTATLSSRAAVVQLGLPYDSTLETVRIETDGTAQDRTKRIVKVGARVYQSLNMKMGPNDATLDRVIFRTGSDPLGRPPEVFSGDVEMQWQRGWEKDGYIVCKQDQPLPLTIMALYPRLALTGD